MLHLCVSHARVRYAVFVMLCSSFFDCHALFVVLRSSRHDTFLKNWMLKRKMFVFLVFLDSFWRIQVFSNTMSIFFKLFVGVSGGAPIQCYKFQWYKFFTLFIIETSIIPLINFKITKVLWVAEVYIVYSSIMEEASFLL